MEEMNDRKGVAIVLIIIDHEPAWFHGQYVILITQLSMLSFKIIIYFYKVTDSGWISQNW